MTEQKEPQTVPPLQEQPPGRQEQNFLPASILVAAVLISASIFYNTALLVKKIDQEGITGNAQTRPSVAGQQNTLQQNAEVLGAQIKVADRKDAPLVGNRSAAVTIVEFLDFQCPFCQKFYQDTYQKLKAKYVDTGQAKFIFRHFPLPSHQNAQKAAEAAECANYQGKFLPYHDFLFERTKSDGAGLAVQDLKQYAKVLGLDASKFNACLDSNAATEAVKTDLSSGQAAGVSGTPTFFINGQKTVGALPFSVFEQAIEEALKQ